MSSAPRKRVLLVDDEPAVRFGVCDFLRGRGFEVVEAEGCAEAEAAFRKAPPDIAIVDYSLPDGNALELLPRFRELDPSVPVVILTAHGSVDLAVKAIKEGAEQFLTKPVQLEALAVILERLIENQRNRQQQMARRSRLARELRDPFLGSSAAIRALAAEARKVAASDSPVLIQGETGAGKGVLARWLHENGPRAEDGFVDLNCAGLSREFLETELFGHEKGAFTGATAAKPGLLEVAHRGTVFLDEIGDVDLQVQPKLLKVLEDKQFRRMGDVRDRRVDIRLITATHQGLAELVREKKFRSDLYFRISTIPLTVPPLRERPEDIPVLAERVLESLAARSGHAKITIAEDAMRSLVDLLLARQHPRAAQRPRARHPALGQERARPPRPALRAGGLRRRARGPRPHAPRSRARPHRARPARRGRPRRGRREEARHPAQLAVPEDQEVRDRGLATGSSVTAVSGPRLNLGISRARNV